MMGSELSIKKVMITVFFITRQLIAVDALPQWQKHNQGYFVQNIFPSLLNEKKRFSRQKTAINFSVHIDNSICHNGHRAVDELCPLDILRVSHHPTRPEEILPAFQELWDNIIFKEL
jgi:hypothetical protein